MFCTFILCWRKRVSHLEKKLIKVKQKRRKITYFYKSVNVNFFHQNLKFYQNLKNRCSGNLKKLIWWIYVLHNPQGLFSVFKRFFCFNVHKLHDSFTFIWKTILCLICLILCHILSSGHIWVFWHELKIYSQRVWFFNQFKSIALKLRQ